MTRYTIGVIAFVLQRDQRPVTPHLKRIEPTLDESSGSRNAVSRLRSSVPHFSEIQLARNIAVIQTLARQAIDRTKDTRLFPEAAHFMPP